MECILGCDTAAFEAAPSRLGPVHPPEHDVDFMHVQYILRSYLWQSD